MVKRHINTSWTAALDASLALMCFRRISSSTGRMPLSIASARVAQPASVILAPMLPPTSSFLSRVSTSPAGGGRCAAEAPDARPPLDEGYRRRLRRPRRHARQRRPTRPREYDAVYVCLLILLFVSGRVSCCVLCVSGAPSTPSCSIVHPSNFLTFCQK